MRASMDKRGNFQALEDVEQGQDALFTIKPSPGRSLLSRLFMPTPKQHPRAGRRTWQPEEEANLFSRITYEYLSPLMHLGYVQPLIMEDLPDVNDQDRAELLTGRVQDALRGTTTAEHPRGVVLTSLWHAFRRPFLIAGVYKAIQDGLQVTGPIILQYLLANIQKGGPTWYTAVMIVLMAVLEQARIVYSNLYFHRAFRVSMGLKTGVIDMIFRKSLLISGAVRGELGLGKIINFQSNDGKRIWETAQFLHQLWSAPEQVLITIALLMRILKPVPALVGLLTTIAFIPVNAYVGRLLFATRKELIARTDKRVKMITEVLQGIKAIKLYAWEKPYLKRVEDLREEELRYIRRTGFLGLINIVIFLSSPVLVSLTAFITFVGMGNQLTASVAFPALALFNLLRFPIMMLPMIVNQCVNAHVSLKRLQDFFDSEEAAAIPNDASRLPPGVVVAIKDATFQWSTPPPKPAAPEQAKGKGKGGKEMASLVSGNGSSSNGQPVEGFKLEHVNLEIQRGELLMVIGEVGSGKTSLLMGLLREMAQKGGEVLMAGSIAYTSQDTWIQNATLQDNILMGLPMDEDRYNRVVSVCALDADLDQLPAADQTEIGEKGVNLSGGQKQRVALARATYADADIYLLDDPLSAVDAHVGQHLFSQCIAGQLGGKTRVLVTHQLQFLAQADRIVVMERGRVAHWGTFAELQAQGVSFTKYQMADKKEDKKDEKGADGKGEGKGDGKGEKAAWAERSRTLAKTGGADRGNLTRPENRATGSVDKKVYSAYFLSWGPLFLIPVGALVLALGDRGLQAAQQFWLAIWSNAEAAGKHIDVWYYMGVYAGLGLGSVVLTAARSALIVVGSNNASRNLCLSLLQHVVRLPMSFFDSQPLGRLLNRFTSDLDAIDTNLSQIVSSTLTTLISVVSAVALMVIVTPGIAVAILFVGVIYWRTQRIYVSTSRELKRLDSVNLSPIFSGFSEMVAGLPTVRAFRKQEPLTARNIELLNRSNRAFWPQMTTNRWLSMRLESQGNLVTTVAALAVTVITSSNSGFAGLVISSAMSITGVMNWLVRQVSELEVAMNAVERITEYRSLPTEAAEVIDDKRPPPEWPAQGSVEIKDLQVRYRAELDLVLKGISVTVEAREKVGVCGRTGCGKSTLMLALYRIVEPAGGYVAIDGINTSHIGLFDLRSKLALVPQDPVIFSGTIRSNLDPFNVVGDDARIWESLDRVHLRRAVEEAGGLDAGIAEAGGNLSVGQRQLLCTARALLRNSRVLLLDEATSSVDSNTDTVIQQTIRTAFADCTVLTIAHRLHTIIDSDKILLLDHGNLKEFDHPHTLLQRPGSSFGALIDSTSRGASGAMRRAAAEAAVKAGVADASVMDSLYLGMFGEEGGAEAQADEGQGDSSGASTAEGRPSVGG